MRRVRQVATGWVLFVIGAGCSLQELEPVNQGVAGHDGGGFAGTAAGGSQSSGGNTSEARSSTASSSGAGGSISSGGATNTISMSPLGGQGGTAPISSGGTSAGGVGGTSSGGSSSAGTGGGTGGAASGGTTATPSCNLAKPFGNYTAVVPSNATSSELGISVSPDGLSAIVATRPDESSPRHLKSVTRTTTTLAFGNPTSLPGSTNLDTADSDSQPRLSRDGLMLFFSRSFTMSSSIHLVMRASRSDEFGVPAEMDTNVNISGGSSTWISADNKTFYWVSDFTVYRGDLTSMGVTNVQPVPPVNRTSQPTAPVLTEDQLTLYFATKEGDSAGATTNYRVWRSTRASALVAWSEPSVVTELADEYHTYPSDISPDGCIIYLSKYIGTYHIYQARKPY
ncbi:MAG: hypothetical protein QM784_20380 [Polyangiaceae bacterium]